MAEKKVWKTCTWCQGSGKESPGSQHLCGQCWGKGGHWETVKTGSSGGSNKGCALAGLALGLGLLLAAGFGVSKVLAASALF